MIIQDDAFFSYDENLFGGTEYMARYFHKNVAKYVPRLKKYNCLIFPGLTQKSYFELAYEPKEIILWLHCLINQYEPKIRFLLTEKRFIDKIKYIVTVSEYHKQDVVKETGIHPDKVVVIYNAIDPIENNLSRFNNVITPQLIYTSAAERGLMLSLRALHKLDLDFRLNIFNEIVPDILNFNDKDKKVINDSRFFFYGKTPHKTVLDYMSKSHIFVYPSIWHETFCISLAEALSSNCLCVYSNLGALNEIGNNFGISYKHTNNIEEHIEIFSEKITEAIKTIKNNKFNPGTQAQFVNNKFSWEVFTNSWIKLNNLV